MTAESGEDGAAASITATAAIRRETNNEKTRRVREILDAYLLKAPPAAQWPPSRRMRVRGVDIHYKVSYAPEFHLCMSSTNVQNIALAV